MICKNVLIFAQEVVKNYHRLISQIEKWFKNKGCGFSLDQKIVLLKLLQDSYRDEGQNFFEEKLRILIKKAKLIEQGIGSPQIEAGVHDLLPSETKEWDLSSLFEGRVGTVLFIY